MRSGENGLLQGVVTRLRAVKDRKEEKKAGEEEVMKEL